LNNQQKWFAWKEVGHKLLNNYAQIMKDILINIVKAIVDKPDQISVVERQDGEFLHLELSVAPEDTGKVIGRQGRTAKAIRTLLKAAANKENKKVMVDIL